MAKREDKILADYIKFFGEDAPRPPMEIMEALVKMKHDGNFEEVMGKMLPAIDDIKKKINEEIGSELKEDDQNNI
tara:strand:+ start:18 stop:242 length:225 start_codon:yes stop_codon:yes gene_type:complete